MPGRSSRSASDTVARAQSMVESRKATEKPRTVTNPTLLPPCSNALGIIVSASIVGTAGKWGRYRVSGFL